MWPKGRPRRWSECRAPLLSPLLLPWFAACRVLYERLVFVRRFILHGPGGAKAASSQDAPAKRSSGRMKIRIVLEMCS